MSEMYITTLEEVDLERHRSPIIIHDGWQWYFAEFNNWEQLEKFLNFAGLDREGKARPENINSSGRMH